MLLWWLDRQHLSQGMPFTSPNTTITITMDASIGGLGGHCIILSSGTTRCSDLWTRDERQILINMLELRAVHLTILHLEQEVLSQAILATVSYINRQGGMVSKNLNDEACTLFKWLIHRSIGVSAIHPPGVNNELTNCASCRVRLENSCSET